MSCTVTELATIVEHAEDSSGPEDSSDPEDSSGAEAGKRKGAEQPRQKKRRCRDSGAPRPAPTCVSGRVYVASMNMCGEWAPLPEWATTVDAMSEQATQKYRRDFSPMSLPAFDDEMVCFENAWQSLKEHEHVPWEQSRTWWQKQTTGKRRYPRGKGKRVLWVHFGGEQLDCVAARKKVYVPEYNEKMRVTESFRNLRRRVENGEDVVVMDFDGPRTPKGKVACKLLTVELLRDKIEDVTMPFGHGYVVAAGLAGVATADYVM
jgi:hypothetical protein